MVITCKCAKGGVDFFSSVRLLCCKPELLDDGNSTYKDDLASYEAVLAVALC